MITTEMLRQAADAVRFKHLDAEMSISVEGPCLPWFVVHLGTTTEPRMILHVGNAEDHLGADLLDANEDRIGYMELDAPCPDDISAVALHYQLELLLTLVGAFRHDLRARPKEFGR